MPKNAELLRLFTDTANFLELTGEGDRFKVEAYRRAARSIESLDEDVRKVADRGELGTIPGVGEALAEKIREYLRTGKIEYYERLAAQIPPGLLQIMQIPGVGPKTTRRFWVELKVESPAQLAEAIEQGRLSGLKGFGARKIQVLREGVQPLIGATAGDVRRPILVVWELAERVVAELRSRVSVDQLVTAGSLRRGRETVGDIDLLATSSTPEAVFDAFSALEGVREVRLRGETKETVIFAPGIQIDLRVVPPESFGAALQYFTGSKEHNIHLRSLARDRGLKINEYGVFRGEASVAGRTEEEVYAALNLRVMPPEIRENHGEIEAAEAGQIPKLVEAPDLRGDLHVHLPDGSTDGIGSWKKAAQDLKLRYLGIILHPDVLEHPEGIRRLRESWESARGDDAVRLLVGAEWTPGSPEKLPTGVDYSIVNGRAGNPVPPGDLPALDPFPTFLGHLPSHDSGPREGWIEWARAQGLGLEVTPQPGDDGLDSGALRRLAESGVPLFVTSGSHRPEELGRLHLAVRLARRGWLVASAVANTREPTPPRRGTAQRART
ncbi:MAG TPA: helix-hairpin-helix domain-containing protein [Thermoplasmata archaeon]|nr:helix-hairpin-helix domain-containing protein [Thermoplasmata archaeon]